jgi:hypothetical protein
MSSRASWSMVTRYISTIPGVICLTAARSPGPPGALTQISVAAISSAAEIAAAISSLSGQ